MKELLIDFLFNILPPFLTAILTTYIVHKLNYKHSLKAFMLIRKKEVFEQFISSFDNIYALAYNQKPFIIINAINNVLLYLDDTKRAPFIELRNALDVATEQDIEMLQTKFDNCVAVLQEEVK